MPWRMPLAGHTRATPRDQLPGPAHESSLFVFLFFSVILIYLPLKKGYFNLFCSYIVKKDLFLF